MSLYRLPLVKQALATIQTALLRTKRGFEFGNGLRVFGWPSLRCVRGASVRVGRDLVLISNSAFSAVGVSHACIINAMKPGATIKIGDDVGMSGASICCEASVIIGDRVMLGADVVVADTDFHPIHRVPRRHESEGIESLPVVIEDDVFVGMRAIVLKGAHIGRGAIIGAASVVTGSIPPFSIAAGRPARIVGNVAGPEGE